MPRPRTERPLSQRQIASALEPKTNMPIDRGVRSYRASYVRRTRDMLVSWFVRRYGERHTNQHSCAGVRWCVCGRARGCGSPGLRGETPRTTNGHGGTNRGLAFPRWCPPTHPHSALPRLGQISWICPIPRKARETYMTGIDGINRSYRSREERAPPKNIFGTLNLSTYFQRRL